MATCDNQVLIMGLGGKNLGFNLLLIENLFEKLPLFYLVSEKIENGTSKKESDNKGFDQ